MGDEPEGHHIHVHTCSNGLSGHIFTVDSESVRYHLAHRVPVGNHQTVKAPLAAEHIFEQEFVAGRGHSVVVVERGHKGLSSGLYSRLERRQVDIAQLPFGKEGAVIVTAALGSPVSYEMLDASGNGGRIGSASLISVHHGFGHSGVEVRILAAALGDTAPAGVARYIEHGRESPADTLAAGFDCCHAGPFFNKCGIESGGKAQRYWEDSVEPVNHVACHQQRYSETGLLDADSLELVDLDGIDLIEYRTYLALAKRIGVVGHTAPSGYLVHLPYLLGERHLREQLLHPLFDRGIGADGRRSAFAARRCQQQSCQNQGGAYSK